MQIIVKQKPIGKELFNDRWYEFHVSNIRRTEKILHNGLLHNLTSYRFENGKKKKGMHLHVHDSFVPSKILLYLIKNIFCSTFWGFSFSERNRCQSRIMRVFPEIISNLNIRRKKDVSGLPYY